MSQRHQEAARGDGVQEQQVTVMFLRLLRELKLGANRDAGVHRCCLSAFSSFLEDNKKLTPRRDVPSYPKVRFHALLHTSSGTRLPVM